MYRKLYWVVEEEADAGYAVTGVFTSIPDLLEDGLVGKDLRLTLTPLDKRDAKIGSWTEFSGIAADLEPLIETGEFRREDVLALAEKLATV